MQVPGLSINGLVYPPGASISEGQLRNPDISWPSQPGETYTLLIGKVPAPGQLRIVSMVADITPWLGQPGLVVLPYEQPPLGPIIVGVYRQSAPAAYAYPGEIEVAEADLPAAGLTPLYRLPLYSVRSKEKIYPGSNAGGLMQVLRRVLEAEEVAFVDVSRLQTGPYGKGLGALAVRQKSAPGLLDVPDFPIISADAQHWDLAMDILANVSKQPLWRSLRGRWRTVSGNPDLYQREILAYSLTPPRPRLS